MILDQDIVGKYVTLRSAALEDAEFTLAIRQDKWITRYLPYLDITLEQQISWIESQRKKERDYFFVVWNKKEERVGTIGIYNITTYRAEVGRQATIKRLPFEAVEAVLLTCQFGFEKLGLKETYGHIFPENKTSLRMAKFNGGSIQKDLVPFDGKMACKVITPRESFYEHKAQIVELLDTLR